MKTLATMRIEPALLAAAWCCAKWEDRLLDNPGETVPAHGFREKPLSNAVANHALIKTKVSEPR
ncbi:hypothetical protein [Azospirillum doebereinerae]|uniref:Uncharacterized protein n=1 Tax=Azospirillum doebereinerae TaxID=92933 RepID=A0A3S1CHK9_9PROT|nr:hypothetical protein [Azospirillum doebereinerae]RUQ72158.1 hypothetical protein EJ913_11415 [Azospirillum doebereinerae]